MSDSQNVDERCVLCLDKKRFPVSIECGHSFCLGCLEIYKSYKKYPWANKCPICRDVIKEKQKPPKRKHPDLNANAQVPATDFVPAFQNTSNASSLATQHNNSWDEFMSLAANYFDDNRDESDNFLDSYEYLDHSAQNLSQGDEHFSTPYSQADEDDSYEEELDFSMDSFDLSGNYDDRFENNDNDDDDEQFYYENDEYSHERPGYYSDHSDSEVGGFINVDDDDDAVTYENDNYDIDWETVIASDIILID